MKKWFLLDRDGVLIKEEGYIYGPTTITLLPNVSAGLGLLRDHGAAFFIVSNQSGIGRGLTTASIVEACNQRIVELLKIDDIHLQDIAYCPHHPDDGCVCRKPSTGMWDTLAARHQLVREDAIMIGNREVDMQFGKNIGCVTALIGDAASVQSTPNYVARDLLELAGKLTK